jgi:hypothetical protein
MVVASGQDSQPPIRKPERLQLDMSDFVNIKKDSFLLGVSFKPLPPKEEMKPD